MQITETGDTFIYVIQNCFICRQADSTVSEDAGPGIEHSSSVTGCIRNSACLLLELMTAKITAYVKCFQQQAVKPAAVYREVSKNELK
jgi:hypothetical protein